MAGARDHRWAVVSKLPLAVDEFRNGCDFIEVEEKFKFVRNATMACKGNKNVPTLGLASAF